MLCGPQVAGNIPDLPQVFKQFVNLKEKNTNWVCKVLERSLNVIYIKVWKPRHQL